MKRQKVRVNYTEFNDTDDTIQLTNHNHFRKALEHTLEATVLEGDTLASIALRFNCTVADLKRLNKIDKDNEIFARKILKIPITPHNVLLDTVLPTVHKSGNSSPRAGAVTNGHENGTALSNETLEEKLIVASISNTTYKDQPGTSIQTTTTSDFQIDQDIPDASQPLLFNNTGTGRQPQVVLAKPKVDFSFNGSDCDMNWLCLFVCILALCFAIPLIYVYFIYEEKVHPEHFHQITTNSHL